MDAGEGERRQRQRLEGGGCAVGGSVDAVHVSRRRGSWLVGFGIGRWIVGRRIG